MKESLERLKAEINRLESELREREKSLPAHTIRPHQIQVIEELEDKIRSLKENAKALEAELEEGQ